MTVANMPDEKTPAAPMASLVAELGYVLRHMPVHSVVAEAARQLTWLSTQEHGVKAKQMQLAAEDLAQVAEELRQKGL